MNFLELNDDVLDLICKNLSIRDLHRLNATNKSLQNICQNFITEKILKLRFDLGDTFIIILDDEQNVWTWGRNKYDGTETSNVDSNPIQVLLPSGILQISTFKHHSLALCSNGHVWAWRNDFCSQFSRRNNNYRHEPVFVGGLPEIINISAGGFHSLALDKNGKVWSWGNNEYGQLGNETTNNSSKPIQINFPEVPNKDNEIIQISAGGFHSLALDKNGNVWSWGYNEYGQLGNETTNNSSKPIQINFPEVPNKDNEIIQISAGYYHSLALDKNGNVWSWGYNEYVVSEILIFPTLIPNFSGIVQISAGKYHSLALNDLGEVWAWGCNREGQLGDGTRRDSSMPIQVSNISNIKQIVAREEYSAALDDRGNIWIWGKCKPREFYNKGYYVTIPNKILNVYMDCRYRRSKIRKIYDSIKRGVKKTPEISKNLLFG